MLLSTFNLFQTYFHMPSNRKIFNFDERHAMTGTELLSGKAFEGIAAGGNEGYDGTGSIHID